MGILYLNKFNERLLRQNCNWMSVHPSNRTYKYRKCDYGWDTENNRKAYNILIIDAPVYIMPSMSQIMEKNLEFITNVWKENQRNMIKGPHYTMFSSQDINEVGQFANNFLRTRCSDILLQSSDIIVFSAEGETPVNKLSEQRIRIKRRKFIASPLISEAYTIIIDNTPYVASPSRKDRCLATQAMISHFTKRGDSELHVSLLDEKFSLVKFQKDVQCVTPKTKLVLDSVMIGEAERKAFVIIEVILNAIDAKEKEEKDFVFTIFSLDGDIHMYTTLISPFIDNASVYASTLENCIYAFRAERKPEAGRAYGHLAANMETFRWYRLIPTVMYFFVINSFGNDYVKAVAPTAKIDSKTNAFGGQTEACEFIQTYADLMLTQFVEAVQKLLIQCTITTDEDNITLNSLHFDYNRRKTDDERVEVCLPYMYSIILLSHKLATCKPISSKDRCKIGYALSMNIFFMNFIPQWIILTERDTLKTFINTNQKVDLFKKTMLDVVKCSKNISNEIYLIMFQLKNHDDIESAMKEHNPQLLCRCKNALVIATDWLSRQLPNIEKDCLKEIPLLKNIYNFNQSLDATVDSDIPYLMKKIITFWAQYAFYNVWWLSYILDARRLFEKQDILLTLTPDEKNAYSRRFLSDIHVAGYDNASLEYSEENQPSQNEFKMFYKDIAKNDKQMQTFSLEVCIGIATGVAFALTYRKDIINYEKKGKQTGEKRKMEENEKSHGKKNKK